MTRPSFVSVTDKDGGVGADTVALEVARFPTMIDVAPNKDGRVDLVLYFYKSDMAANGDLTTATTKLILLADDSNGRQTRGEDIVSVKP